MDDQAVAKRVDTTQLLLEARRGSAAAENALVAHLYEELRRLAHVELRRLAGRGLQTTELVHEAYVKLCEAGRLTVRDRGHFFALAARVMRQVLVDRFRGAVAQKRGGPVEPLPLHEAAIPASQRGESLLAIDQALTRLAGLSERLARVVELKFFGGMSEGEIADTLEISVRTVNSDWRKARAWLTREISL